MPDGVLRCFCTLEAVWFCPLRGLARLTGPEIATAVCALPRNDTVPRHSEAVTDVTAVGIFLCQLIRCSASEIATPV